VLLAGAGVALALWTLHEARIQRQEIQDTLASEAFLLAETLGPSLAAASAASRELDELVVWKLLDNARLLAELHRAGLPPAGRLERIVEASGLDAAAFLSSGGTTSWILGEGIGEALLDQVGEILTGEAEETILGSALEDGIEHLGAAAATDDGGAAVVIVEASAARAFARRLGVENLLGDLVGTGTVLYLCYCEEPSGGRFEASWDDGPVPPPPDTERTVRPVRDRVSFEMTVPVASPAGMAAHLRVGLDAAPLQRAASSAMRRTLLVGVVLAGMGLVALAYALLSRLRAAERQETSRRLAEMEAAQRRSERLAAAGALAAGLAHEVRSPLNAIGLAAQRLERKLREEDERRPIARRIREEVARLEGVLQEFLELARPVSPDRPLTELGALAGEVVELLAAEAEEKAVRLRLLPGEASTHVDPVAIRRAMINVVRNAIQSSPRGGHVEVAVGELGESVFLRVHDDGSGLDPEMADRLFEAFVSTRADGTGLGLAMVRRVMDAHGGSVCLRNRVGAGAEACLTLPRQASPHRPRRIRESRWTAADRG
jgi:signal transduction histidine kinase